MNTKLTGTTCLLCSHQPCCDRPLLPKHRFHLQLKSARLGPAFGHTCKQASTSQQACLHEQAYLHDLGRSGCGGGSECKHDHTYASLHDHACLHASTCQHACLHAPACTPCIIAGLHLPLRLLRRRARTPHLLRVGNQTQEKSEVAGVCKIGRESRYLNEARHLRLLHTASWPKSRMQIQSRGTWLKPGRLETDFKGTRILMEIGNRHPR